MDNKTEKLLLILREELLKKTPWESLMMELNDKRRAIDGVLNEHESELAINYGLEHLNGASADRILPKKSLARLIGESGDKPNTKDQILALLCNGIKISNISELKKALDQNWIKNIKTLDAELANLKNEITKLIANESSKLAGLTTLRLNSNQIDNDGIKMIAQSPHLENLNEIDLAYNNISTKGLEALVNSPYLKNLKVLKMCGNQLDAESLDILSSSEIICNLTELDLSGNKFNHEPSESSNYDVSHLLRPGKLEKLTFNFCREASDYLALFLDGMYAENITHLSLANNNYTDRDVAFIRSINLSKLTHLNLANNKMGAEVLDELIVEPLDKYDEEDLDELTKEYNINLFQSITHLDLSENNLGPKGMEIFNKPGILPQLTHLDIGNNKITAKGIRVIIESDKFKTLSSLNIGGNKLGEKAQEAVIKWAEENSVELII